MKLNFKLLSVLCFAFISINNSVNALNAKSPFKSDLEESKNLKENFMNNDEVFKDTKKDQYYMVFVNNDFDNDGSHSKRENTEQHLYALANEINNLIMGNRDTYENPSKLEKIEQKLSSLRKRENQSEDPILAYPISSLEDKSIIYSYLSETVAEIVKTYPNVIACVPDRPIQLASQNNNKNIDNIKKETQWNGVSVRENSDIHLSLLSQGKYDENLVGQYDKNYYYPSSAGEDIDVFIFDSGFNFRHSEFSNNKERITKCAFAISAGKVVSPYSDDFCSMNPKDDTFNPYHGEMVSDVVGGLTHGVASKSNIYGVNIFGYDDDEYKIDYSPDDEKSEKIFAFISGIIAGLQYIKDKMLRSNKAVFNFSLGAYLDDFVEEDKCIIDYWKDIIDEISDKGAVFVASAGNEGDKIVEDGKPLYFPCGYDNVICVGATDNAGLNEEYINYLQKRSELEANYYNEIIELMRINNEIETDEIETDEIETNEIETNEIETDEIEIDEIETDGMNKNEIIEQISNKFAKEVEKIMKDFKNKMFEECNKKIINSENYVAAVFSNFGTTVDIYAPGYANIEYKNIFGEDQNRVDAGTSFSSPIVAGVAATIMSDNPDIQFNSKTMRDYLINIGLKDVIIDKEGRPNVFINNGKHVVYSPDNQYYGCGPRSGNQTCSDGLLCSNEGECLSDGEVTEVIDLDKESISIEEETDSFSEEENNE